MDPYWRKVFERSEQYLKGAIILQRYMYAADKEAWHKSGLLSWQAPHFASVNPLIDYAYNLKNRMLQIMTIFCMSILSIKTGT